MLEFLSMFFLRVSNALGVRWAPRDTPMKRRIQTLAAAWWICFILFGEAFSIFLFIKLIYSSYWWVALLYGVWMLNDIDICNRGGRKIEWIRNSHWWRCYCDYFPISLVKTAELDPNKNYLFACFPHGVVSSGAFGAFATNALDFYNMFPGMTCNLITLAGHFSVPFFRDYALALGACSSTPESLKYLLDIKKNKGNCVALMVGGAAEALDSHPGEYKIVLSRRKGFIRIALQTGAPLVPVFSFGEPDVFHPPSNPENSFLRRCQEFVRKWTGISPMFPVGRGVFQYSYGFMPLRNPVHTVVGAPLHVEKILEPTDEQLNAVHAQFTQQLVNLFNTEKHKYLQHHENVHLIIT